jgi:hypothetical protein
MENQGAQHVEDAVIDVEEFARAGKPVPKEKRYRIRVDKEKFVVTQPTISGSELLALVGKTPDKYNVYLHVHGGQTKLIKPDEKVDLTEPGVERFTTMKIENTEG